MKQIFAIIIFVFSMSVYAGVAGWSAGAYDGTGWGWSGVTNTVNGGTNTANAGATAYGNGYIKWPGPTPGAPSTITILIGYDDNSYLNLDGVRVLNAYCCRWTPITITRNAGDIIYVNYWTVNTGGPWYWGIWWDVNHDGSFELIDSTYVATTADYWVPPLAGGASSAAFNANPINTAKVQTFNNRTTADTQVFVEQIGNFNTATINQTGTKNNYVWSKSTGSNNTTTITQSGNASTVVNYAGVGITGNNNSVAVTQTSTGGGKGAFISVTENNNSLILKQEDSGNHYAEVNLRGGNKIVDITQRGSGNHMTSTTLTGLPTELSLTQSGATQQFYSINFNCATAGGCPKITVTQGQ
jgi:hypothetical protein